MPQIKSAIKRVKTQANTNKRRSAQLSELRTAVKKFKNAVEAGTDDVENLGREAMSAIDKAATRGLIHKNKANRDKSRLSKLSK